MKKHMQNQIKPIFLQASNIFFITTTMDLGGLTAPMGLPPPPIIASLIRAIELSNKDNLLACAQF
jgi:hypothetical protein